MSFYASGDSIVLFDAFKPRQYNGASAYEKAYTDFFAAFPGPAKSDVSDISDTSSEILRMPME